MRAAQVGIVQGNNRYDNVLQVLQLMANQIDLRGKQRLVIKPNFVSTTRQLPSTHVDAVRAVLDFLRQRYDGRIVLAEGAALANSWEGIHQLGYDKLLKEYSCQFIDLNADEAIALQVYNRHLKPQTLQMARTVVDSDFRISVGPPKTHDTVIVTLSLKNMIMGALVNQTVSNGNEYEENGQTTYHNGSFKLTRLIPRVVRQSWAMQYARNRLTLGPRSDKMAMHQGYAVINLNLAMLASWAKPHLAVIDGFQAMEGAGPIDGDPVEWRLALAGTDALAVDCLTAHLMGFAPESIGYLAYCQFLQLGIGDVEQIEAIGEIQLTDIRRSFRPHPTYQQQLQWQLPAIDTFLKPASPVPELKEETK